MRAELHWLHSPDTSPPDSGLEDYRPEDPDDFHILVQAMIGPKGEQGEESFDIVVCSPTWIAKQANQDGFLWGRHYLILATYDYPTLLEAIQKVIRQAEGPDWETVATYLSRYGHWEFEDYRPYGSQ